MSAETGGLSGDRVLCTSLVLSLDRAEGSDCKSLPLYLFSQKIKKKKLSYASNNWCRIVI